jgi:HAD superfamily hydrolase (TIGR01509 family)
MTIKLVIFDCDGTLVDSELVNNHAISDVLKEFKISGYDTDRCVREFRGMSLPEILNMVSREVGRELPQEEILTKLHQIVIPNLQKLRAVDGAKELVESIKIAKAVVSNGVRESVVTSLQVTNLLDLFHEDMVFTRDQVRNPKPAPDLFLYVSKKCNIAPENILVIEDSVAGVLGARAAGMRVLGFIGTARDQERAERRLLDSGANEIIDNLQQVARFL